MSLLRVMTFTFLRIFSRDRQAIFFSLFFPLVLMGVFGLVGSSEDEPFTLGVVDQAGNDLAGRFMNAIESHARFELSSGEEAALREAPVAGAHDLVLGLPPDCDA